MAESIVKYMEPFSKLFNMISEVLSILHSILSLKQTWKKDNDELKDFLCRLETLNNLLHSIEEDHPSGKVCKAVCKALKNLKGVVISSEQKIKNSSCNKLKFDKLNQRLTNAYERLTVSLHVYEKKKLAEQQQKLDDQKKQLTQQQQRLHDQEKLQAEQQQRFDDQKKLQAEQQNWLIKQQQRLDEQEKKMQKMKSDVERKSSCIIL